LGAFVLRRLVLAAVVLAALSFVSFAFFASQTVPLKGHPLLPAYWTWLTGLWGGRSFHSLTFTVPVEGSVPLRGTPAPLLPGLLSALGHTAVLLTGALLLVVVFSVVLGVAAARRPGSALDVFLRAGSYLAWAVPAFLLALLIQLGVNSVGGIHGLGPFPLAGWPGSCPAGIGLNGGTLTCPPAGSGARYVLNVLRYVTLPVLALAVGFVGLHGRYLRSSLLDALGTPYVVTARAKGLSERNVIVRHALRNSLVTFVSALLADFGAIFGAALAVDWIFQLRGLGAALVSQFPIESFAAIDTYAVQLLLLVTGCLVVVSSILSELAVVWLDPRVRADG
jgi:peptide/nickel transport system permease protein